jgi:hypothetical protein
MRGKFPEKKNNPFKVRCIRGYIKYYNNNLDKHFAYGYIKQYRKEKPNWTYQEWREEAVRCTDFMPVTDNVVEHEIALMIEGLVNKDA